MTEPTPPPRPRRYLVCIKCSKQGDRVAPEAPAERWTCPRCMSEADTTDRNWRGVGAGQ
jgi:hypothetical protein